MHRLRLRRRALCMARDTTTTATLLWFDTRMHKALKAPYRSSDAAIKMADGLPHRPEGALKGMRMHVEALLGFAPFFRDELSFAPCYCITFVTRGRSGICKIRCFGGLLAR